MKSLSTRYKAAKIDTKLNMIVKMRNLFGYSWSSFHPPQHPRPIVTAICIPKLEYLEKLLGGFRGD